MARLYKYTKTDMLSKIFADPASCNFKCSKPADFNDPYELFLTVDFNLDAEHLATYRELLGEIPQYPVTCFSKSPAVVPMWAHYGGNHEGVVIEVDEDRLRQHFPELAIKDVEYRREPDPGITNLLQYAVGTRKGRHNMFFIQGAKSAAYFTKYEDWRYEQERRVVDQDKYAVERSGVLLLPCPVECITALIVGSRASAEARFQVRELATRIGASYYEMKIAKSTSQPYFLSPAGELHLFDANSFGSPRRRCENCGEPAKAEGRCSWCAITEADEQRAAGSNILRAAADAGLLDGYLKSFNEISKGRPPS